MNQTQRSFLIKKIEETSKIHIDALKSSRKEYPNLNNYLLHEVMSDRILLQNIEHIKSAIKRKALNAKSGEGWMNDERWGSKPKISFDPKDIFVIPESYNQLRKEVEEHNLKVDSEIRQLSIQSDSLITRIQLASDKTLQTMINEVDDMGDISLMDTKIKQLSY